MPGPADPLDRREQTTLIRALDHALAHWPDRISFDCLGHRATYAEVETASNRLANGLARLGIGKGDTVSMLLDNSFDAILLFYAIGKLGAVSAPVNTGFKGEFLRHQLADTGARILIAESAYLEAILPVADDLPAQPLLVVRGGAPAGDCPRSTIDLDALRSDDEARPTVDVAPEDLAMLIYTSGTTGPSKGCMISHNYLCNMGKLVAYAFELGDDDVFWTPLPLFHVNALNNILVAAPLTGAKIALAERFSLSRFWPEVARTGATVVSLIGSMIPLIANAPGGETQESCFGQIRIAKGAPFTPALKEIWKERFGVGLSGSPGYGMTEMNMITLGRISDPSPPGACGSRFEDFDVRIVDDNGNECPPGVVGEIVARPMRPNIMFSGYWKRPEATVEVCRNLWFHTGDFGRLDAQGFLTFVDRKKDYLRRGGENISSFEMEATFRKHPLIEDIAVHSVFSEMSEDEVKVTAVLKPDCALDEEDLCRWAIDRVPRFAVPRYIEFRGDLPRTPTGRVLKFQLREEGVTPGTWDRERSALAMPRRSSHNQTQ